MLTLTPNAKEAIHLLTADGPTDCGVRIAAAPSSADGQGSGVSLAVVAEPEAGDEVIDDTGARVFIQPAAAQLLGDQTLDAQVDQQSQQVNFVVR